MLLLFLFSNTEFPPPQQNLEQSGFFTSIYNGVSAATRLSWTGTKLMLTCIQNIPAGIRIVYHMIQLGKDVQRTAPVIQQLINLFQSTAIHHGQNCAEQIRIVVGTELQSIMKILQYSEELSSSNQCMIDIYSRISEILPVSGMTKIEHYCSSLQAALEHINTSTIHFFGQQQSYPNSNSQNRLSIEAPVVLDNIDPRIDITENSDDQEFQKSWQDNAFMKFIRRHLV